MRAELIIAVLNPKGGSGKTTLSTNLARALQLSGKSVLLVDSDPQGSARDWYAVDNDNPMDLVAMDRPNVLKSLKSVAVQYDHVVIDGAAKLEDMIAAAIKISDLIVIPVQPSPYDLWAASDLVEVVKARQEITDGTPRAGFAISRMIEGTKLSGDVRTALDEYDLPTFKTTITQRQIYPQVAAEGKTIFEGTNAKAKDEINALTDEILTLIDMEVA